MRNLLGFLAIATGCATLSSVKAPPPGGTVHTYRQGSGADHANVYWFETPSGPVIVDAPLTVTEAKKLRDEMVQPYRIYVTAARPERFGSLDTLRDPDVPVISTPAVATEIQNYGQNRLAPFHKRMGDDVPFTLKQPPNPSVEERTNDIVGQVEVELLPLGPAESESSLALYLPKTGELITGDVVSGGEHLDLTWGRSVQWQDRINELKALQPKFVYPGHGKSGGSELLEQTATYLKFFHDTVAEKVKPGAPAKIARLDFEDVKRKMIARFREYGREELLEKSIPAEYAVQLAALPPAPAPDPTATPPAGTPPATTPAKPGAAPATPPAGAKPGAATTTTTPPPAQPVAKPADKPADKNAVDDLLNDGPKSKKKKKK